MIHQHELHDAPISINSTGFKLEGTVNGMVTVDLDDPPPPPGPTLSDWSLTPTTGPAGTEFAWEVTYQHPTGLTPSFACVVVVFPNVPPGKEPRQWITMSTADGRRYRAVMSLPAGQYAYQFEFGVAGTTYATPGVTGPLVSSSGPGPTPDMGPLVRSADPRYFARPDGQRVFLTGSHTWDCLQDFRTSEATPRFDFPAFVAWLQAQGHNYTRLWRWEYNWWQNDFLGAPQAVDPHPWPRPQNNLPRAADGLGKFDLSQFDQPYLVRLDDRVADLEAAGIYCSVMLFEGCVSSQFPGDPWRYHPFAPGNNLQGIELIGPAEFYSAGAPAEVLTIQRAYVRQVVQLLNRHRNLLWEISNETMASSYQWQCDLVGFIRQVEAGLPLQHPVGITAMVRGGTDEQLVASPADWISPAMANYQAPTFPNATGKVVLLDTDHLWGLGGTAEWVRQAVANGYNPIFMDPYLGNVVPGTWNGGNPATWQAVRQAMGEAQRQMNG